MNKETTPQEQSILSIEDRVANKITFKNLEEFITWLIDNEGYILGDSYGREWRYNKFLFQYKDIGENEFQNGLQNSHLFLSDFHLVEKECTYCGIKSIQPEASCYANPNNLQLIAEQKYPKNLHKWADNPSQYDDLNESDRSMWLSGANEMLPIIKELGEALKEIQEANTGGVINTHWMQNHIQTVLNKYQNFL